MTSLDKDQLDVNVRQLSRTLTQSEIVLQTSYEQQQEENEESEESFDLSQKEEEDEERERKQVPLEIYKDCKKFKADRGCKFTGYYDVSYEKYPNLYKPWLKFGHRLSY